MIEIPEHCRIYLPIFAEVVQKCKELKEENKYLREFDASAARTFGAIVYRMGTTGELFIPHAEIGRIAGVSASTVERHIETLMQAGFIVSTGRKKRRRTNTYILTRRKEEWLKQPHFRLPVAVAPMLKSWSQCLIYSLIVWRCGERNHGILGSDSNGFGKTYLSALTGLEEGAVKNAVRELKRKGLIRYEPTETRFLVALPAKLPEEGFTEATEGVGCEPIAGVGCEPVPSSGGLALNYEGVGSEGVGGRLWTSGGSAVNQEGVGSEPCIEVKHKETKQKEENQKEEIQNETNPIGSGFLFQETEGRGEELKEHQLLKGEAATAPENKEGSVYLPPENKEVKRPSSLWCKLTRGSEIEGTSPDDFLRNFVKASGIISDVDTMYSDDATELILAAALAQKCGVDGCQRFFNRIGKYKPLRELIKSWSRSSSTDPEREDERGVRERADPAAYLVGCFKRLKVFEELKNFRPIAKQLAAKLPEVRKKIREEEEREAEERRLNPPKVMSAEEIFDFQMKHLENLQARRLEMLNPTEEKKETLSELESIVYKIRPDLALPSSY